MRKLKVISRLNNNSGLHYMINCLIILLLLGVHVDYFREYQNLIYVITASCILFSISQHTFYISKDFILYFLFIVLLFLLTINFTSFFYLVSIFLMILWFNSINFQNYNYFLIFIIICSSIIPGFDGDSYCGVFGNNIMFAGVMVFGLYLSLNISLNKISKLFLILFIIFMIILAKSKTHIVISTLLLLGIFFKPLIKKIPKIILLLSFFAPFIFMFIVNNYILGSDFQDIKLDGRSVFNLSGRTKIYDILPVFINEFPLGVGLGNSSDKIINYYNLGIGSAHNAWIKSIFETGILGFFAFVIFVFTRLKTMKWNSILFLCLMIIKFSFEIFTPLGMSFLSLIFIYPILENLNPKSKI